MIKTFEKISGMKRFGMKAIEEKATSGIKSRLGGKPLSNIQIQELQKKFKGMQTPVTRFKYFPEIISQITTPRMKGDTKGAIDAVKKIREVFPKGKK